MKFFGSSSGRRKAGEAAALDEFSFHIPSNEQAKGKRLEVECFKKKREFKPNMISKHINSLESLRSDTDSDYDSIPRSEDSATSLPRSESSTSSCSRSEDHIELCESLAKFRLEDTIPRYNERTSTQNSHKRLQETSSVDSNDSIMSSTDFDHSGIKVLLFPEEEWARNAKKIQWTIKFNRYWKSLCIVTESSIGGLHVKSAEAKVVDHGEGSLTITGRFKRLENPDFQLDISANLSKSDFQNGYTMSGDLKQGDLTRYGRLEVTHFAAVSKDQ